MKLPSLLIPGLDSAPHFSYALRANAFTSRLLTASMSSPRYVCISEHHKHLCADVIEECVGATTISEQDFLTSIISDYAPDMVLCGSDFYLSLLWRITSSLRAPTKLCSPNFETFNKFRSKTKTRIFAEALDVPVPPGKILEVDELVETEVTNEVFPLVFKFDTSESSSGVTLVETADQLTRLFNMARLVQSPVILETFLGATQEVSHQFYVHGHQYYPVYSLHKLSHLSPSFSTAVASLSVDEERKYFDSFVRFFESLDDGLYSAQFKFGANGTLFLIEVNCRLGNNARIVARMFPSLVPSILRFYGEDSRWREDVAEIRRSLGTRGFSVVEDLVARTQRTEAGNLQLRLTVRRLMGYLRLICTGAKADDYFVSFFKWPRICIGYYIAVWKFLKSQNSERRRKLSMVGE